MHMNKDRRSLLRTAALTFSAALALSTSLFAADAPTPPPSGPQTDGDFQKVILDSDRDTDGDGKFEDTVKDPMELAVAKDGRVVYILRAGEVRLYDPKTKETSVIGDIKVFTGLEDGLLGVSLDPNFLQNNFIYVYYANPETTRDADGKKAGESRIARFTLKDGKLDPASEKILLRVATQREQCCHSGGSMTFDAQGNLYQSTGDNTNPFGSDGYAPIDKRPGRSPWSSEKSAANANDLRGKILRIHPEPDGSVTIPKGNLFPPGTAGTRPEVYTMGHRNPFRISVDQKTGYVYWGDVGPDAGTANPKRGPAGFDEVNQARGPGFFGWPYFIADNKAYVDYDFETRTSGEPFDPAHPINNSPFNTGIKELPPAQPAFVYYPGSQSARFPVVNGGGGRTAMAGPVYYFDERNPSRTKLPREFDHTLFIYEWSRNWIIAVHLDADNKIKTNGDGSLAMERFCSKMTFKRPMDMELGPDGCLYLIEYGTNWSNNQDSQIVRIEYHPQTHAAAGS
jgi:cytochrome c